MTSWEVFNELRKKAAKLTTTAESQAYGVIGIVLGYLLWLFWNKHSKPWITAGQLCLITYSVALAAYALLSRSYFALKRCLLSARLLFLAETVTETEYNKMRSKCLKKANAI
jgi:hypothetical protein